MSNVSGDGESFSSGNKGGDEPFKHYTASTPTNNSDGSSIQQQQPRKDKKKRNSPGNPRDGESFSSGNKGGDEPFKHHTASTPTTNSDGSSIQQQQARKDKRKRNPPGNPDPDAEVIALSPKTLMTTKRFVCEICHKGFLRDQNLQLHRRGHNLPWKLKQRTSPETRKRVYVCPETCCVYHNPARALGDLTGIKKHYSRKHGEKKWKCDKCLKKYAVQSDWKVHSRTCGTRVHKCNCGTIFSRKDSFFTHRAFCDAIAEENCKINPGLAANMEGTNPQGQVVLETMSTRTLENKHGTSITAPEFSYLNVKIPVKTSPDELLQMPLNALDIAGLSMFSSSLFGSPRNLSSPTSRLQRSTSSSPVFDSYKDRNSKGQQEACAVQFSATSFLQKAAEMGPTMSSSTSPAMGQKGLTPNMAPFSYSESLKHLSNIKAHHDQSQTIGVIDSYMNIWDQRRTQEISISEFHDSGSNGNERSRMCNVGTYTGLFNQNLGLRNFEGSCGSNGCNFMTLDLLGIGGFGHSSIFHGMQQQEMDFGASRTAENASFGYISTEYDSSNN